MFIKLFIVALVIFLALDLVWITIIAKELYKDRLATLVRGKPDLITGFIIYPLITLGLTFFVIQPAFLSASPFFASFAGAFFGLIIYGAYDLNNYATVKNWPISVSVIDIVWGMTLCATTASITYLIGSNLGF